MNYWIAALEVDIFRDLSEWLQSFLLNLNLYAYLCIIYLLIYMFLPIVFFQQRLGISVFIYIYRLFDLVFTRFFVFMSFLCRLFRTLSNVTS